MGKRGALLQLLLSVSVTLFSQDKVYKKEIFPLLEAKNYELAKPRLAEYLSNPKHADEASPHYQFGLMIEKEFKKQDILFDSMRIFTSGDSAIGYFNLAKTFINEKELKKNDEYWQTFFRRDLRTGDFGIKVSDVHLDIEKQVEKIELKIKNVHALNQAYFNLGLQNSKSKKIYEEIINNYSSHREMLLKISKDDKMKLDMLVESSLEVKKKLQIRCKKLLKHWTMILMQRILIF